MKVVVLLLIFSLSSFARDFNADDKRLVSGYVKTEQFDKIIGVYENEEIDSVPDDVKLITGVAYRKKLQFSRSIAVLESITSKNLSPNKYQELALSYYEDKNYNDAIASIDKFLETSKPSSDVEKNMQNFKTRIKREQKLDAKIFGLSISEKYMYDTNPNSISSKDSLFSQYSNLRSGGDSGFVTNADINYKYRLTNRVRIFGSIVSDYTKYLNVENRDFLRMTLMQGIQYEKDRHSTGLVGSYSRSYIDNSNILSFGDYLFTNFDFSPFYSYKINKNIALKTSYLLRAKDTNFVAYVNSSVLNGVSETIFIKVNTFAFIINGFYGHESSDRKEYENQTFSAGVTARKYMTSVPVYFDLGYSFNKMMFMNVNASYENKRRNEMFNQVSLTAHYLYRNYLDMFVGYDYGINDSNVSYFNFDRHRIMVGAKIAL